MGCSVTVLLFAAQAQAEIRLSSDWARGFDAAGRLIPADKRETSRVSNATKAYAWSLSSVPLGHVYAPDMHLGFRLHLDDTLYYITPAGIITREREGEVCTPADYKSIPTYMCEEGQRLYHSCHLLFLNKHMLQAGALRLRVYEPFISFCNAVPAMGVGDKARNELLVTIQYFDIGGGKVAKTPAELGRGWRRMTVAVRLNEVDGQIVAEQDDRCLGNPNNIDTIPDARKALKACATAQR